MTSRLDPERYNLGNLFYEAVGDEPAGKVVVLAHGYTDTSMGGGTKLMRLHEHGCAGVLTDGRLRDFEEPAGYDLAAYCSGEATRWGRRRGDAPPGERAGGGRRGGGDAGPVRVRGLLRAVVISEGQLDEVLAEARRIEAEDAGYREQIAASAASTTITGGSAATRTWARGLSAGAERRSAVIRTARPNWPLTMFPR